MVKKGARRNPEPIGENIQVLAAWKFAGIYPRGNRGGGQPQVIRYLLPVGPVNNHHLFQLPTQTLRRRGGAIPRLPRINPAVRNLRA
jgi:hypothetical protein